MTTSRSYPFRFYGSGCTDWYEGANMGHGFSVRFAAAPDEVTAAFIANQLEAALFRGPVELGRTWLWSGPVAHFYVGERFGGGSTCIERMGSVLRRLHASVPIVDVVFAGARAGGDDWSAWSLAQGVPSAGPALEGIVWPGMHGRAVDPALAPAVSWDVFDAALVQARAAVADTAFDAKLAAQPADGPRLVEVPEGYLEPDLRSDAPAALSLATPSRVREGKRWLLGAGDHPERYGSYLAASVVSHVTSSSGAPDYRMLDIAWVDGAGTRRQPSWPRAAERHVGICDAHPSRPALLVSFDGVLFEVDLLTAAVTELYRGASTHAAYLDGAERLAITHDGKVSVIERIDGGWTSLAERADSHSLVRRCLGPDGFVTSSWDRGVTLYRHVGKKLVKVASTALGVTLAFERDGELYLHRGARLFHWAGAADAWRSAAGKSSPSSAKASSSSAKPKASRPPAPSFVAGAALPDVAWAPAAWATRIRGRGFGAVSSRGDVAEYYDSDARRFHYDQLAFQAVDGEPQDLSALIAPSLTSVIDGVAFDRDDRLLVRSGSRMLRVTPAPFGCEVALDLVEFGPRNVAGLLCHGDLVVVTWTDTVAFLRRGRDTFATATTLSIKGVSRVFFVDEGSELALVGGDTGAHVVQRAGDKLKRIAKHSGKVTRAIRIAERTFVADGDREVAEVVGLPS